MDIPAMAPIDRSCFDGFDCFDAEFDCVGTVVFVGEGDREVERDRGVGRGVQKPFQVPAQSVVRPTGGDPLVKDLLCGFVSVFGPGAWARYHSPNPSLPFQATPINAACKKARPSE